MLIIDGHEVYEIDEECIKKYDVNKECEIMKKIRERNEKTKNKKTSTFTH